MLLKIIKAELFRPSPRVYPSRSIIRLLSTSKYFLRKKIRSGWVITKDMSSEKNQVCCRVSGFVSRSRNSQEKWVWSTPILNFFILRNQNFVSVVYSSGTGSINPIALAKIRQQQKNSLFLHTTSYSCIIFKSKMTEVTTRNNYASNQV